MYEKPAIQVPRDPGRETSYKTILFTFSNKGRLNNYVWAWRVRGMCSIKCRMQKSGHQILHCISKFWRSDQDVYFFIGKKNRKSIWKEQYDGTYSKDSLNVIIKNIERKIGTNLRRKILHFFVTSASDLMQSKLVLAFGSFEEHRRPLELSLSPI